MVGGDHGVVVTDAFDDIGNQIFVGIQGDAALPQEIVAGFFGERSARLLGSAISYLLFAVAYYDGFTLWFFAFSPV